MARKVIITAALTGAFHGKEAHPALPEQPDEIAIAARDAYNAGASIVHLHARDKEGASTDDPKIFSEINSKVRNLSPVIIQDSTAPGTRPGAKAEHGMRLLREAEFLPEMCSLDTSLIYSKWGKLEWFYEWTRDFLIENAKLMKEKNIKPELEVFNIVSIEEIVDILYPKGVFTEPLSFSFVMGMEKVSQGSMKYSTENLMDCIKRVPKGAMFSALAIGKNQLPGTVMTMLMGGNVRVGFEDNVYYSKGLLARDNAHFVERIARLAIELGLEVATPDEAREMLGIPPLK